MFSKRKKIIILSVMVALLVVTGYLNIALNRGGEVLQTNTAVASFYDSYRAERQLTREELVLYYNSIIANSEDEEDKTLARESRQKLLDFAEQELFVEGLIKGIGFEDVVLTMPITESGKIMVVVKATREQLTDPQLMAISTIVTEQTGRALRDIRIVPSE